MRKIAIIILATLIAITSIYLVFILTHNTLKEKPYTYAVFDFNAKYETISKDNAIKLCKDLVGDYKIKFTNKLDASGLAVLPLRYCYIKDTLNGWDLLEVLTHELVHLKYYTINERFTEFTAFKLLYESDNEILINRAKWIAREICTDGKFKNTKYDCSWYIVNYFKNIDTKKI